MSAMCVSNHRRLYCLLNRLFRRRSKKASKLRATGLCGGKFTGDRWIPRTKASNAEKNFYLMTSSCQILRNFRCVWLHPIHLSNLSNFSKEPYHCRIISKISKRFFQFRGIPDIAKNNPTATANASMNSSILISIFGACFQECHEGICWPIFSFGGCSACHNVECCMPLWGFLPISSIYTSTDWKEKKKIKVARRYFIKWKVFFVKISCRKCFL